MFNRNATTEVSCPKCHHKKVMRISEVERNQSFICPKCNEKVKVDGSQLKRELSSAEKALKETLGRLK